MEDKSKYNNITEDMEKLDKQLSGFKNAFDDEVPEAYFETLPDRVVAKVKGISKSKTKIILLSRPGFYKYAIAAVILLLVFFGTTYLIRQSSVNTDQLVISHTDTQNYIDFLMSDNSSENILINNLLELELNDDFFINNNDFIISGEEPDDFTSDDLINYLIEDQVSELDIINL